jgi:predicted acylesterase/phospholipase RssA
VIDLLKARAARGTRAPHGDGARIALAIEGGAMRGVVSAGMVAALEQLGLTHAFDAVYGSSAGAINGAYFLTGQANLGATI